MFQALGGRGGQGSIGLLIPLSWALLECMVRKGLVLQGCRELISLLEGAEWHYLWCLSLVQGISS